MEIYKKGDAKLTRRVAYYAILLLIIWGGKELAKWLGGFSWARTPLVKDIKVPFYQLDAHVGSLVGILVTIAVGYFWFKWINKKPAAQLLVETETELKKVAWPSWDDARQSTIIVMVFVVLTAGFLTVVELALNVIFTWILA